jgi:hypothetical protein
MLTRYEMASAVAATKLKPATSMKSTPVSHSSIVLACDMREKHSSSAVAANPVQLASSSRPAPATGSGSSSVGKITP